MNTATEQLAKPFPPLDAALAAPAQPLAPLPRAARAVLGCLDGLAHGQLTVELPDGRRLSYGQTGLPGELAARLRVRDWQVFADIAGRGDIGFGEAYLTGSWDTPDLAALLTLINRNRDALAKAIHGRGWTLLIERLRHLANANTRAGSRRNIMAHYDLGNDFYARWLDPSMSYSSALFAEDSLTLADAQAAKYRRIVEQLAIKPGDSVLEIGCGWGGFAEMAARAGARVTGITLSPAQLEYARQRLHAAGLADRTRLELVDYRDLAARREVFDHVVSIEMFEAVGERWWPAYFATVRDCLKPGGSALIQTITIADGLFSRYRRHTDFIQQHVFPGGMLPSPTVFSRQARSAGLTVDEAFAFGFDYARTLALWRAAFARAWPDIAARGGFDQRFRRLWDFYLAYCQAGFAAGSTDVIQFRLRRPA